MVVNQVERSKLISYLLRHVPGSAGIELRPGGWARTDQVVAAVDRAMPPFDRRAMARLVREDGNGRFSMTADGRFVRANHGHTCEVDLEYQPRTPPAKLYHGTSEAHADGILEHGIEPGRRQYVHLSPTREIAWEVGARHGRPQVLVVDSGAMAMAGMRFFHPASGVWLTPCVPPRYLQPLKVIT